MQNHKNSSPRQGQTTSAQGGTQEKVPRLPNERDESADSQQAGEISAQQIGKIAHADMENGTQDTGKGPEMDAAYKKTKGPSASD